MSQAKIQHEIKELANEIYNLVQFSNLTFSQATHSLQLVQKRMDELKRVKING
jgi:conjugal transfer/entry exclusion protein